MPNEGDRIDPIAIEVIHSGLRSISDESYVALMKSAYSTNIKERHDHSCAIMDARGRTIVQASLTQSIHLSSMLGHIQSVLARYPLETMQDGDIFISNDPYAAGGSHLPDVNFAMPIFHSGRVIAFSSNIAHHADFGGMVPGSMSSDMTEIYQEGVRLPVVRLFQAGVLNAGLFDAILLNVRVPQERRGDIFAQVASCRLANRRMLELLGTHGRAAVLLAFDEIVERTEMRIRRAIADLPDGTYTFEDVMDNDGRGSGRLTIRVAMRVAGDRLHFDFAGTAGQTEGNINSPFCATQSAVCYAVKVLLDPDGPNNQGLLDAVEIDAMPGSLLNAIFPSPVAYRAHTAQRIVDVVLGAFSQALPERVIAASNGSNTTMFFSGVDPRNGAHYLYMETLGGGCGARAYKDGKDGVQQHIPNTANLPVEAIETEYPLRIREYSLVPDTGGAGRFRGGLALRRVIEAVGHTSLFSGAGERFETEPWGLFGGQPGRPGRFWLTLPTEAPVKLRGKTSPTKIPSGAHVAVETPGAGGYGPPDRRDAAAIAQDLRSGKFSKAFVAEHYGVTADDQELAAVDPTRLDYVE